VPRPPGELDRCRVAKRSSSERSREGGDFVRPSPEALPRPFENGREYRESSPLPREAATPFGWRETPLLALPSERLPDEDPEYMPPADPAALRLGASCLRGDVREFSVLEELLALPDAVVGPATTVRAASSRGSLTLATWPALPADRGLAPVDVEKACRVVVRTGLAICLGLLLPPLPVPALPAVVVATDAWLALANMERLPFVK
jgi:hypothetical protein